MEVTRHSIDRLKERCGVKNQRSAEKAISLAMQRGKIFTDCTSWEQSFLQNEAHGNCTAIAYNNFCYLFNEFGYCVTVYPLPAWFGKKKHFDGKDRIRNYKKYCKNQITYTERCAIC